MVQTIDPVAENKTYLRYAAFTLLLSFILFNFIIGTAFVSGESMLPTYRDGTLLVFMRNDEVSYGDVVIVDSDSYNKTLIKRVIGMSGDEIEIISGTIYRNGEALTEQYASEDLETNRSAVTVPDGCLYIVGDNRTNSLDSRYEEVGFVDASNVRGVVLFANLQPK